MSMRTCHLLPVTALLVALLAGCAPAGPGADEDAAPVKNPGTGIMGGPITGTRTDALAVAPDGRRALASNGRELDYWDLDTGKRIPWPPVDSSALACGYHEGGVRCVVFSADGTRALTGGSDNLVKLWDLATGREIRRFTGHQGRVSSVALSPNGHRALSGSEDGTLRFWDVDSGEALHVRAAHSASVWAVALSPDGRLALSGGADGVARLWDAEQGKGLRRLAEHSQGVNAVAFSPDGKRAATGEIGDTVRIWDVSNGVELRSLQMKPDRMGQVLSLDFTPTGRYVLVADAEGMKLWEVSSGKVALTLEPPIRARNWGARVVVFADGKRALTTSGDGFLILWDLVTGEEIRTLYGPPSPKPAINAVAFSPEGKLAASAGLADEDEFVQERVKARVEGRPFERTLAEVKLWEIPSGRLVRVLWGHQVAMTQLLFTPDGRFLLSASLDGTLKLWEVATGKEVRTFRSTTTNVYSFALSPDGRLVATASLARGSSAHDLKLWDVGTGKELRTFPGNVGGVRALSFSGNGKEILSAGAGTRVADNASGVPQFAHVGVKIWDIATGECVRDLSLSDGWVIAFLMADQRALLSSGKLWDLSTHAFTGPLEDFEKAYNFPPSLPAFSPEGTSVLGRNTDGTLTLWDLPTGKRTRTFVGKGVPEKVQCVAFSPDGRLALSGGVGGSLKLWDIATGQEIRSLVNLEGFRFRGDTDRW
jgi:WD40 repeat protein